MVLARWTATVQDATGNGVAGCQIEVRSEETGLLVPVFSDRDGTAALGNPFTAVGATFGFHVIGGVYRITATKGPFQSIWRYVGIGTMSEFDFESIVFELQSGLFPAATLAALQAYAPAADQSQAGIVLNDPNPANNGYYLRVGSSWVRQRPLPDTMAALTVMGGTANAIEAAASPGVDPGAVKAFWIDVPTANTGPVTISINGGPARPAKDVNGNDFANGVFKGRMLLSIEADGRLKAVVGGDLTATISAVQALSEQARLYRNEAEYYSSSYARAFASGGSHLGGVDLNMLLAPGWAPGAYNGMGPNGWGTSDICYVLTLLSGNSPNFYVTQFAVPIRFDHGPIRFRSGRSTGVWESWRWVQDDLTSPWQNQPLGVPIPILVDLSGSFIPPTSSRFFRYAKLTAADGYNAGILTSESISGSAPRLTASAVVSLADSPLSGQSIRLLNTERRFLRAGNAGSLQDDAFREHSHSTNSVIWNSHGSGNYYGSGSYGSRQTSTGSSGGDETRPRNIGVDYYMRIK